MDVSYVLVAMAATCLGYIAAALTGALRIQAIKSREKETEALVKKSMEIDKSRIIKIVIIRLLEEKKKEMESEEVN